MNSTPAAQRGKPTASPPPRREQVLVIAHHDNWIECFAERHIDVRIVMMPYVGIDATGEILAEQWLEQSIPECYRNIYFPGNLRAAAKIETILPSKIAWRNAEMSFLRLLNTMANQKPISGRVSA